MRLYLLPLIALLMLASVPALANRTMEVQNIQVEETGPGGRDAAVAQATKQAAQQVWLKLGRTGSLPSFTPAQLQNLTTYVDISNEVAQPNFYSATFNIGINLAVLGGGSASTASNSASSSSHTATNRDMPDWVLIVPAHEVGGQIVVWDLNDKWASTWNRAVSSGLSTAAAGGDANDKTILSANDFNDYNADLDSKLRQLAAKYDAPAVALVTLTTNQAEPMANEEVQVSVTYLEPELGQSSSLQTTLFTSAAVLQNVYAAALSEGQKLLLQLANPQVPENAALVNPYTNQPVPSNSQSANFGNTYTGNTTAAAGSKLWVRIPLSSPTDLANYRRKIDEIPGARFEIIALNRMYVEGNIVYAGDHNILLQQLASRGLYQQ